MNCGLAPIFALCMGFVSPGESLYDAIATDAGLVPVHVQAVHVTADTPSISYSGALSMNAPSASYGVTADVPSMGFSLSIPAGSLSPPVIYPQTITVSRSSFSITVSKAVFDIEVS